ncbi:hypothetical protein GQ457_01G044100 [Hibiscus cannabinus]
MGGSSPCASCKLLRRRCAKDCIFAPYFPSDDPHKFAIVHKVFGASNVSKMLQQRADAVSSLVYEANARVRDPVYGCVGAISFLQNQVSELQMQLAVAQAEMLCIQMQHQVQDPMVQQIPTPTAAHAGGTVGQLLEDDIRYDDKQFLLHNHHHQFINSSNNCFESLSIDAGVSIIDPDVVSSS